MSQKAALWRTKKDKDGNLYWEAFPSYDIKEAHRKLNTKQNALDYGVKNQPSNNNDLTTPEKEMLGDVNDHIVQLRDWHAVQSGEIRDELNKIEDGLDINQLVSIPIEKFLSSAREERASFQGDQNKLLRDHALAKRALEAFKVKHGLEERYKADYPESKLLHFALLFVALAIEGFVNAAFFPQDLGLVGGFVIAVLVSLGNVGICFLAGWLFLRELNHKNRLRKAFGLAGFIAISILVIGIHSSVAHYREAIARNPGAEFISSFTFDPRGLQDMHSLLLIAIGITISVFAMWKGYTFDDPYPKFGDVFRAWKELDDDVSESKLAYKQKVGEAYDRTVREVHEIPEKLRSQENDLIKYEGEIGTYFACVNSYYQQARLGAQRLLTTFRNTVQKVWERPDCLSISPTLLDEELELLDPRQLESEVIELLNRKQESNRESLELYDSDEGAIHTLKELENKLNNHVSDTAIGELVSEIKNNLEFPESKPREQVSINEEE